MFTALYIPDFPVAAILRTEPALREQAVAILDGTPPLLRVMAANERAREAGIELGMTRMQAEAGAVELRRRSPAAEAAAHAALLDCAHAFSPRVEDTAPDTVVFDAAGLERLFGPPPTLAREVAQRAAQVGLEAHVAIAANPDAAVHAAHGFAGVTVIAAGEEAARLGSLPIDVLFAGAEHAKDPKAARAEADRYLETFDRWGVRTFRALANLPEIAVTERLGQPGLALQRLARGAAARPLVPCEAALEFVESLELEYPVDLLEPLAFLLGRLLEQLCARLAARSLATNELRVELALDLSGEAAIENSPRRHGGAEEIESLSDLAIERLAELPDGSGINHSITQSHNHPIQAEGRKPVAEGVHRRTLTLPVPMLDAKVFLKLLQLELKAHPPGAPVQKVTLAAEPVKPRYAQGGLFLPVTPEAERLELTLARISAVVGEGRVGAAEVVDTHGPEGFRLRAAGCGLRAAGENPPQSHRDTEGSNKQSAISIQPSRVVSRQSSVVNGREPRADSREQEAEGRGPTADGLPKTENRKLKTAMRVLRPPQRVTVEVRDGVPVRVYLEGARCEVISAAGPWRTTGDWWKQEGKWARDEWDVAVKNGAAVTLYRMYREMESGAWFVYGSFD